MVTSAQLLISKVVHYVDPAGLATATFKDLVTGAWENSNQIADVNNITEHALPNGTNIFMNGPIVSK